MQKIYKRPGNYILIGHQGEHKARQICIDISSWMDIYGSEGDVELIYQRPGDDAPYPIPVEREGDCVLWTITNTDTEKAGAGHAELRYCIGDTLVKSSTSITNVSPAMDVPDTVPDPPGQSWLDQVLEAARRAEDAAEQAVEDAVIDGLIVQAVENHLAGVKVATQDWVAEQTQEKIQSALTQAAEDWLATKTWTSDQIRNAIQAAINATWEASY